MHKKWLIRFLNLSTMLKEKFYFLTFCYQLHEVDWNDSPNCKLSRESLNHFGKGFLKNFLASICKDRDLLID